VPGPSLVPAPPLSVLPAAVTGAFSTRAGGGSAPPYAELNLGDSVGDIPDLVADNRLAVARQLAVPRIIFARQVHGADVATVDGAWPGDHSDDGEPRCDALVTALPGVALGVLVADCVPVLLADSRAGVIGVAHAGRRGLVAGVLANTVAAMSELGSDPVDVVAVIGPAIGGCCYEVPAQLQAAVAAAVPDVASRTSWGTPSLDLPRGAAAVLRAAGVPMVRRVNACTAQDDRFFSYRRCGVTGRFAGVVLRR
jgi:polyphenol oxidase